MARYAVGKKTVSDAVDGGGLLVVAQREAKDGQADKVAEILSRFLPEAQREPLLAKRERAQYAMP